MSLLSELYQACVNDFWSDPLLEIQGYSGPRTPPMLGTGLAFDRIKTLDQAKEVILELLDTGAMPAEGHIHFSDGWVDFAATLADEWLKERTASDPALQAEIARREATIREN